MTVSPEELWGRLIVVRNVPQDRMAMIALQA